MLRLVCTTLEQHMLGTGNLNNHSSTPQQYEMLTCGKTNQAHYFLVWYENQVCSWGLIALQLGTDCAALAHAGLSLLNSLHGPGAAQAVTCTREGLATLETMNQLDSRGLTELHHYLTAPLMWELQTVLQTPLRQLLLCVVQFICLNVLVTAWVEHPKHSSR